MNVELVNTRSTALVIRKLDRVPAAVMAAAARGLNRGLQYAAGIAERRYLRGPRPKVLDVVTGRLVGSIATSVETDLRDRGITGRIGSNVAYAAWHEFGFRGAVNVKAFRRVLKNVKGGADDFESAQASPNLTEALLGLPLAGGRRPIKDRQGRIIGFKENNRDVSRRLKTGVAVVQFVKAHTRTFNYPGKPYIGPALRESEARIQGDINREIATVK